MGEDKKSIIKQNEHTCVPLTNEEVKVKLATQDLKDKLRDTDNSGTLAQSMFISMQSTLAGQQGIQYEALAKILKPFSVIGNGLQKIRAKLVPKDDPNVLNLEHLTGEQILTTDGQSDAIRQSSVK